MTFNFFLKAVGLTHLHRLKQMRSFGKTSLCGYENEALPNKIQIQTRDGVPH